jgi:serine/threonine protein kinase
MDRIGSYKVLGELFRGPRPLYRVQSPDGRVLAMKTAPVAGLSEEMKERFRREAAICTALDHPNIIKVHDSGEDGGVMYQVMDLLEGEDLSKALLNKRELSWDQRLNIMEQACDGLQYAHERKLVHRDIKPANLFLENSGRVRLLDFGMARLDSSKLTQAGDSLGTLNYMSPEQIRAETCTPASDVFSAAVVFFELACGRHPFITGAAKMADIMNAIVFGAPAPLKELAPDMPEGLDFVLNKALEKDTARRLQTAADFKQALSLCRITLKLRTPKKPAGAAAALSVEELGKTVVIDRPGSPGPRPAPPPKAAPPPPPKPKPAPAPKPEIVFCPSCTQPNAKAATICSACGLPLALPGKKTEEEAPKPGARQWVAMAAVALGVLILLVILFRWIGGP